MKLKKLLVLDVNGLLIDTHYYKKPLPEDLPDARIGNFYVYKRPFCNEFVQFCLENFIVGIWSSAREYNVNSLVDYVFGEAKDRLAFSWHQSHCTDVGLKAPDNEFKPLFMKDLSKLWRREKLNLPWNEGDYGPANTLLVDDTPYKAVLNPPNTAIFPRTYSVRDQGDNFLGGALRIYLEGIRDALNVQTYVEDNPFGEPSITPENPLWSHVSKALIKVQSVLNTVGDAVAQVPPIESVCNNLFQKGTHRSKRQTNQDNYEVPLQLAGDDVQLCNDFPSEAITLQSSKNVGESLENVCQSEVSHDFHIEQGNTSCQKGKERPSFSGLHKADEEQHENDQLRRESAHANSSENHECRKTEAQTSSSLQHEDQGALEHDAKESTEKGQAIAIEEAENDLSADAECDGESHNSLEENRIEVNAPRERVSGKFRFSSSKSEWMQGENNRERPLKKHQCIVQRGNGADKRTLNDFNGAHNSDYRKKRRRFQDEPATGRNQRNYYGTDKFGHGQHWKRSNMHCQNDNRNDNNFGRSTKRGWFSYQDKCRDNLGYGQSSKEERGWYPGVRMPSFHGRDRRKDFKESEDLHHETDMSNVNRDASWDLGAKHSRRRYEGWQIDDSPRYFWGSNRASPNRMTDRNYIGQSYKSKGNAVIMAPNVNAFDKGGFTSSCQPHSGFDARMTRKDPNPQPTTTENWKSPGWHFDGAKRDDRCPSEPRRDQGAHSQWYRSSGASRRSYRSNGASIQWCHASHDGRRNGETSWGYTRNRQR